MMAATAAVVPTDQYIVGAFFACLSGFLILFILRRRNSNNEKKLMEEDDRTTTTYKTQNDDRPDDREDVDVIVVGAGVAGAALAHTLGKVRILIHLGPSILLLDW